MRRALVPLVAARLRHAWARWVPTVLALSIGLAVPISARAAGAATADVAFRRGLDALPTADRILTAATYRGPGEVLPERLDDTVRGELSRLGSDAPVHVLAFRPLADTRGGTFQLGAVDDLTAWARVVDGRLPERCEPSACEVVQLAERPPVGDLDPSLGIIVVGTVARESPLLMAGSFEAPDDAAVILADGVERLERLRSLELFGRSQGWLADVEVTELRRVGVDRWVGTAVGAADRLSAAPWNVGLAAPDDVLATEVARARRSGERFLLLGSALGVLLLGAGLVAGTAMRSDHRAFLAVLRRRGTSPGWLRVITGTEAAAVATAGFVLGSVLGAAVGASIGGAAGLPGAEVAAEAWRGAAATCVLAAVAAAGLIGAALHTADATPARAGIWRWIDALVLLCATGIVGVVGASGRAELERSGVTLAVLPTLVLVGCGLATARAWAPATRFLARHPMSRSVAAQVGVTNAAGRPLRPSATAALLAAAIGATVFAVAYRETLVRGAADQAAEAVPIDARVTTGAGLERALDLITPGSSALPTDATAWPVSRAAASVRTSSDRGTVVQMIGVDPDALGQVRRWSATVGSATGAEVGRAIDVTTLGGAPVLPAGRTLEIDVSGPAVDLAVTATLRTPDGRVRGVPMRVEPEGGRSGPQRLVGDLPDLAGAERVEFVALTAAEASDVTTRRQHNLGEGRSDRTSAASTIMLGEVHVDGRSIASPWEGWGGVVPAADRSRWDLVMAGSRATIAARPAGPGDPGDPLPVAVDPVTAASVGGRGAALTLTLNLRPVTCVVAAVLPEFPTVRGRFAIVDRDALARLVDATEPGSGQASEVWVDLGRAPLSDRVFERLTVTIRSSVEDGLRSDPVARSAVGLILGVAALTMMFAVLLLVSFVSTERHDDVAQALAWETEGVTPSELRRSLVWRTFAVLAPAIPFGVAGGLVLARLTARLVAVTATATLAKPPLVAGAGTWIGLAAAGVCVLAVVAVAGAVAASAWRERIPAVAPEAVS